MDMKNLVPAITAVMVPLAIGFAAYKFGKGNLMKAAGAGLVGVKAYEVVRAVTGL